MLRLDADERRRFASDGFLLRNDVFSAAPNRSEQGRRALLFSYQPPGHLHMLELLRRDAAAHRAKRAPKTAPG